MSKASDHFDDLRIVSELEEASAWRRWLELFTLVVVFLAGCAAALVFGAGAAAPWKMLLISAAALCLGFGAAAVFYGRKREQQSLALRADLKVLRARADALVSKFDTYDGTSR